jgi:hypothetical protein
VARVGPRPLTGADCGKDLAHPPPGCAAQCAGLHTLYVADTAIHCLYRCSSSCLNIYV